MKFHLPMTAEQFTEHHYKIVELYPQLEIDEWQGSRVGGVVQLEFAPLKDSMNKFYTFMHLIRATGIPARYKADELEAQIRDLRHLLILLHSLQPTLWQRIKHWWRNR